MNDKTMNELVERLNDIAINRMGAVIKILDIQEITQSPFFFEK